MACGVFVSCRSFFSEIERKKETCKGSDHKKKLVDLINENVSEAKKEMEDEIRSGICGKLLEEDELQGTPSKPRKPPGKKTRSPSNTPSSIPSRSTRSGNQCLPVGQRKVQLLPKKCWISVEEFIHMEVF